MFSFRYISDVCKHKKTILSYTMGQKLIKLQSLVDIFTKYWRILQIHISDLYFTRYVYNHFITNFLQNVPWKNFENRSIFGDDMEKVCGLHCQNYMETALGH